MSLLNRIIANEFHIEKTHVGTAALGCPAERSSAGRSKDAGTEALARSWRALLARTAEGGCPHVVPVVPNHCSLTRSSWEGHGLRHAVSPLENANGRWPTQAVFWLEWGCSPSVKAPF